MKCVGAVTARTAFYSVMAVMLGKTNVMVANNFFFMLFVLLYVTLQLLLSGPLSLFLLGRYHMECLTPPIHSVPVEEWFCPQCESNSRRSSKPYIIY